MRCRDLRLENCAFRGEPSEASVHVRPALVKTATVPPHRQQMRELTIRKCTFDAPEVLSRAPTPPSKTDGGHETAVSLSFGVNICGGTLPTETTQIISNQWNGRSLAIDGRQSCLMNRPAGSSSDSGGSGNENDGPQHPYPFPYSSRERVSTRAMIQCAGNDFHGGCLVATGADVTVRLAVDELPAFPGAIIAKAGGMIRGYDSKGLLLWSMMLFLGSYRVVPAPTHPLDESALNNIKRLSPPSANQEMTCVLGTHDAWKWHTHSHSRVAARTGP